MSDTNGIKPFLEAIDAAVAKMAAATRTVPLLVSREDAAEFGVGVVPYYPPESGEPTDNPGYTRHELPAFIDDDRCRDRYGFAADHPIVRCQLIVHDDDQHAAMVRFDAFAKRGNVAEYVKWGNPWTKVEPGQGPLAWSPSFPRVETPELDKREV